MHESTTHQNTTASVQSPIIILAIILIPVLITAFVMLYMFPETLGANSFAWPITPLMSSMMLGATYLGGAYFFLVVLFSRQWRHVWLGFLPITVFAGTLGIATLLHWDRFMHERFTFLIWTFIYFTVPFILPVLWYRNQQHAAATADEQDRPLPTTIRWTIGALGAVMTISGLLLLIYPPLMIETWPWTLTALTSRVMSACFLLAGLVAVSIAYVNSWKSTRYLLQAQAITVVLMLAAIFIARGNFDWSQPTSWIFTAGLAGVLLLIAITYVLMRE
jgi:hypothetical protein